MALDPTTTYLYVDLNQTLIYVQGNQLVDYGTWSSSVSYSALATVQVGENQYVAIQANTNELPTGTGGDENWSSLVIVEEVGSVIPVPPGVQTIYVVGSFSFSGSDDLARALGAAAYFLAQIGTNTGTAAYTLAQQAYALALASGGTIPALSQLREVSLPGPNPNEVLTYNGTIWIAAIGNDTSARSIAQSAYTIAQIGTNVGSTAYSVAQSAFSIAVSGNNTANGAFAVAVVGTNLASSAYALAQIGTNTGSTAYSTAQSALAVAQIGTNTGSTAYSVAQTAYGIAQIGTNTGSTAYSVAQAAWALAQIGTNTGSTAYSAAQSAYSIAVNGSTTANAAYALIQAGTSASSALAAAQNAYALAQIGTNTGSAAYSVAQTAYGIAQIGTNTGSTAYSVAQVAYTIAQIGTNTGSTAYSTAQTAYSIAQIGTNTGSTAYSVAQSAWALAQFGTNTGSTAYSVAQAAYTISVTGTNLATSATNTGSTAYSVAQTAYSIAQIGTNTGSTAYSVAQTAYGIAQIGTNTGSTAYSVAQAAYAIAQIGTNTGSSAYSVAQAAYTIAVTGTTRDAITYILAQVGTNTGSTAYSVAQAAYGIAQIGTNTGSTAYSVAQTAYSIAQIGTNTGSTAYSVAQVAYTLAQYGTNTGTAAYTLATAGSNLAQTQYTEDIRTVVGSVTDTLDGATYTRFVHTLSSSATVTMDMTGGRPGTWYVIILKASSLNPVTLAWAAKFNWSQGRQAVTYLEGFSGGIFFAYCVSATEFYIGADVPVITTAPGANAQTIGGVLTVPQIVENIPTITAVTATTGATTIDLSLSNRIALTLNASTTLTLNNCKRGITYWFEIIQNATGGWIIAWPATVGWGPFGAVIVNSVASSRTFVALYCIDTSGSPQLIGWPTDGIYAAATAVTATTGATTLDLLVSDRIALTLNASTTIALINGKVGHTYQIEIIQNATGGWIVVWPASVAWNGYSAPLIQPAANARTTITLHCPSAGVFVGSPIGITGTASHLARFSATPPFVLSSYLTDDGGQIGIGTAPNATYGLYCVRNIMISPNPSTTAYGIDNISASTLATALLFRIGAVLGLTNGFTAVQTTTSGPLSYCFNDGNVGIGTTSSTRQLCIRGYYQATYAPITTLWAFDMMQDSSLASALLFRCGINGVTEGVTIKQDASGNLVTELIPAIGAKISGNVDPINYYIGQFLISGNGALDIHWYGGIRMVDSSGTGLLLAQGTIGIGGSVTVPATSKLVVTGASGTSGNPIVRITTGTGISTDETLEIGVHNTDYSWMQAVKQGTAYRILSLNPSGGFVGIGTTTPLVMADIVSANTTNGSNLTTAGIRTTDTATIDVGGTLGLGGNYSTTLSQAYFGSIRGAKENSTASNYAGYLAFQTVAHAASLVEAMRITSAGNVGIGYTVPLARLHVSTVTTGGIAEVLRLAYNNAVSSGNKITFWAGDNNTETGRIEHFLDSGTASSLRFYSYTASTLAERFRIDSAGNFSTAGNVGIGTAAQATAGLVVVGRLTNQSTPSTTLYGTDLQVTSSLASSLIFRVFMQAIGSIFSIDQDASSNYRSIFQLGGVCVGGPNTTPPVGVLDASVGFRVNSVAPLGNALVGNGTNFISTKSWVTLSKAASQTVTNSATLTNDTDLTFAMVASTKYRIRGVIFWDTTAAGDYQYGFTAPASPTLVRCSRTTCVAGGTPAPLAMDVALPGATALVGTGTTGGYLKFDMVFHNGANAANFVLQFAQNTQTNDAGVQHLAGSYMMYSIA